MHPFTPPQYNKTAFHCPHCNTFAKQRWYPVYFSTSKHNIVKDFKVALCEHCNAPNFWNADKMVYPNAVSAPLPNADLPDDIKTDFEEARQVLNNSPKAAAALLRLVIQKICIHLGQKGKNLNTDIGNLVKQGLSPKVQKALDVVRVVGNDAVHPGQIDLNDNPTIAGELFKLVNIIADTMITQPKEIDSLYDGLISDGKKEAILKRDGQ